MTNKIDIYMIGDNHCLSWSWNHREIEEVGDFLIENGGILKISKRLETASRSGSLTIDWHNTPHDIILEINSLLENNILSNMGERRSAIIPGQPTKTKAEFEQEMFMSSPQETIEKFVDNLSTDEANALKDMLSKKLGIGEDTKNLIDEFKESRDEFHKLSKNGDETRKTPIIDCSKHAWVDIGVMRSMLVCKTCGIDKPEED